MYCYSFLHVLKRDTCIHIFFVSCVPADGARVLAQHAKMPWLEPWRSQEEFQGILKVFNL
jgi:hypothetical protein